MKYTRLILVGLFILAVQCWADYLPQGTPRAGGMKDQVLIYNLNGPGYQSKSRKPWISADGKVLYFSIGEYGKEEIWMSVNSSGQWLPSHPVKELNLKGYSSHGASLNAAMDQIYFASSRPLETESIPTSIRWRLFTAKKQSNGHWGIPYLLNADADTNVELTNISGKMDYATFMSRDDKSLYFISNRDGGSGMFDVWCTDKQPNGKWGKPYNLGQKINTPAEELSGVSVTSDNLKLYFSSNRTDLRTHGKDNWNIYCALRQTPQTSWSEASVYQVDGISPAEENPGWGVAWPSISPDGKDLYYSDKGPFLWLSDDFDLFHAVESSGCFIQSSNLGTSVNNIIWYKDEDYLPYVVYLDATTKKPIDTMYDSVLFLAYMGSSSRADYGWGRTNQDDWNYYLNSIFMPERNLDKLNTVVGDVKQYLHKPANYKLKLAVMMPYPSMKKTNFGDVDGDGITENLTIPANRLKVVRWYLNEFFGRWSTSHYSNLDLKAMYWMNEGVGTDSTLVIAASKEVHQRGYLFEWIPYYKADYQDWRMYGFDIVEYQPNYAWMTRPSRGGQAFIERISETAKRATEFDIGMEMEFDERPLTDGLNMRAYLDLGAREQNGYMYNCLLGYYQSVSVVKSLCYSSIANEPYARDAYDNLYRFIKETYPENLSFEKKYRYSIAPDKEYSDPDHNKLTDYCYLPDITTTELIVGFYQQNPSVIFDFEKPHRVEKVYAHLLGGNADQVSFPKVMSVEVSNDNRRWKTVGSTSAHRIEENALVIGDILVKFSPVKARYIKINFTRANDWIKLDEIQVYGK